MKARILLCSVLLLLPLLALAQAPAPPAGGPHPPGKGDVFFFRHAGGPDLGPHPPGKGDVFFFRHAGGPDLGMWWKDSEIVRQLQLSDTQVSQIEQTFLNARLKLIDLRADVERQETMLQPLVDADQMDEARISAQLDQVLAARTKLEKANAMMMFDIRKVLTVEQWKKLRELQHQRERMHMLAPGAPGMMMPPEGPGPATAPIPPPGDDDL